MHQHLLHTTVIITSTRSGSKFTHARATGRMACVILGTLLQISHKLALTATRVIPEHGQVNVYVR